MMDTTLRKRPKLVVVLGATATGKSDIAVKIAKIVNGEIISADSRQVYTGLDIGSGKITKEEMEGVPHYLLDVVDPQDIFTVADFQTLAEEKIQDITNRNKIPILCGGTGFYIQAVVDSTEFPNVPPNTALRNEREKFTAEELFAQLEKVDPRRAREIDRNNKRHLIRALEITDEMGQVPKTKQEQKYDALLIGLELPHETLRKRIYERLVARFEAGMVDEVLGLINSGVKIERLYDMGLEYRYVTEYVVGKRSYDDMVQTLYIKICQFAKRQKTWFKRDKRIIWYNPIEEAETIYNRVNMFISS